MFSVFDDTATRSTPSSRSRRAASRRAPAAGEAPGRRPPAAGPGRGAHDRARPTSTTAAVAAARGGAPAPSSPTTGPNLELDSVAPAVGVAVSSFGTVVGGDITAFFSDMLGQREVGVTLYGTGGALDEFGAQAYYLNREQRWNWGGGGRARALHLGLHHGAADGGRRSTASRCRPG